MGKTVDLIILIFGISGAGGISYTLAPKLQTVYLNGLTSIEEYFTVLGLSLALCICILLSAATARGLFRG